MCIRDSTWFWFHWGHSPLRTLVDDATQEVFLECFRPGGALTHFDIERSHGVAAFLRGVVRNVAHRLEHAHARDVDRRRRLAIAATASSGAGAAEQLDRVWQRDRVAAALDLL